MDDFALHIPSLFYAQCLANSCADWPCHAYRRALPILERAGLIDVNSQVRSIGG